MKIHKGTTRTVITIPTLGVVIKIARISPILFLRALKCGLKTTDSKNSFFETLRGLNKREKVGLGKFWGYLISGFVSNLREFWFSIRYEPIFITPTYFSCGVFSIVRCTKSLTVERMEFGRRTHAALLSVIPYDDLIDDCHHWASEDNFRIIDGRMVMQDYGSPKTQAILRKYAKQLDALDLVSVMQNKHDPGR